MAKSFEAQVNDMVITTEKRMVALMRESLQEVVDIAQTPGVSKKSLEVDINKQLKKGHQGPVKITTKGGRMRVDTGFLRASGQSSLNGMPTGPVRGDPNGTYTWDASNVTLTLSKLQIGGTFFFGWTAAYARYREVYDGFLAYAIQQWPDIVARNTEKIRQRIAKPTDE